MSVDSVSFESRIDFKRDTIGSLNHVTRGASISLLFTRSDGHVCNRRCVNCFQRGFGADSIFSKINFSSSSVMKSDM